MALSRTWTWEFPVSRARLWRYLGDTDWVNEHAGLPRISARYEPRPEGGTRRIASFRRGPFTVEWEERPTIWQAPEFHEIDRRYSRGPLHSFRSRVSMDEPAPDRTRVRMDVDLSAASPLYEPLLPLIAAQGRAGANRAFTLAAQLAAQDDSPHAPDADRALDEFLRTAEDRDVRRMRPYELADRWKLPRRDVLRAFLSATRAGNLNLRWRVICPHCRGSSPGMDNLEALHAENSCPACGSFDAAFDRSVEVTFDARPMRPHLEEEALYCIASPQRSAHVHTQRAIAPGARETAELHLDAGTYDVNAVGMHAVPFRVCDDEDAGPELPVRVAANALSVAQAVAIGSVRISIENATDREAVVRIEDGRWPDTIVTAAQVTALQEFRDQFSSEVLSPGLELAIETIAVLFTDLVGSTAMYSRTGDAPAFRIVTDHFSIIREIVSRYEGAVIKTIGDAVMAVFASPANCFKAALELDARVQSVMCQGAPLRLRVGMHAGPCIVMRANDRIDYFGTTVNLAARLESLANAGEVTLAQSDAERADIVPLIAPFQARVDTEVLPIKGFARPIDVLRLRVF